MVPVTPRLVLGFVLMLVTFVLTSASLWAAPSPAKADTALVELLQKKGVLTADDLAQLSTSATPETKTALLDKLKAKGVLTQEEYTQLVSLLEEDRTPPATVYPTMKIQVQLAARYSKVQDATGQPSFGQRDDQVGGDGFALNRARILVTGDSSPLTSYRILVLNDAGMPNPIFAVAQELYKGWAPANIAAGQLCPPIGYEAIQEESDLLVTDLSAMSTFLVARGGYGVRLLSKRPLPGNINYMVTASNGKGKFSTNTNGSYQLAGRFDRAIGNNLSVGVNVGIDPNTSTTPYSDFLGANGDPYGLLPAFAASTVDQRWLGADVQWHSGPNTVWGEYMGTTVDPQPGAKLKAKGYYLNAMHALSINGTRNVELIAGYQRFDPNTAVNDVFDLTSYTAGINLHLGGSCRYAPPAGTQTCNNMLRLNYIWNHEATNAVKNNKLVLQYQNWF